LDQIIKLYDDGKIKITTGTGYCVENSSVPVMATFYVDPVIVGFDGKRRKVDALFVTSR